MDRLALSLILLGLVMTLGTVAVVLGGASPAWSGPAAATAALAGAAIVGGLSVLERRACRQSLPPARAAGPQGLPLADGAA